MMKNIDASTTHSNYILLSAALMLTPLLLTAMEQPSTLEQACNTLCSIAGSQTPAIKKDTKKKVFLQVNIPTNPQPTETAELKKIISKLKREAATIATFQATVQHELNADLAELQELKRQDELHAAAKKREHERKLFEQRIRGEQPTRKSSRYTKPS